MHRAIYLLYISLLLTTISFGEVLAQQDCSTAYQFKDTIGDFEINNGFGNRLEISGNSIKSDQFFTKEHATAWVIIEFTKNGTFSFDLVPDNPSEDFDFLVFDYFGTSSCDSIINKAKLPIRSNLSRRNPEERSITGLRSETAILYTRAGVGASFSKSIEVIKGRKLLLVFDAPYGTRNDFTIVNSSVFEEEIIPQVTLDTLLGSDIAKDIVPGKVTFHILDEENNKILAPKAILKSLSKEYRTALDYDSIGNIFSRHFRSGIMQRILIIQPGYVQGELSFKWTGRSDTIIEYNLTKLKEGMKLQFENILFQTNSSNILKGSEDELENLSTFLLSNTNLVVEIGGHIYSGKRRNKRKFVQLSKRRAKVVYDYLVEAGVDKKSLKHKGYGNSKMLYRFPKSEKEYRANRRVELTIISIQ